MKLLKLAAMLGVLICATLGIVLALGLVSDQAALQAFEKALIVVGIITFSTAALFMISGKKT